MFSGSKVIVSLSREGDGGLLFLILCHVLYSDNTADATPCGPCGFEFHPLGLAGLHEIIENPVADGLVENPLIAVALKVQLERLEFDAGCTWHISHGHLGKIWMACLRANGREFMDLVADLIVAFGIGIVKNFNCTHDGLSFKNVVGLHLAEAAAPILTNLQAWGNHLKPVDKIWMNGELVNWADAQIHVLSHIVHYGYGVFEGIRCYETPDGGAAIFRLEEHIRRLEESAHILRLNHPWGREELMAACREVISVNGLRSAYIRPTICVGYGALGLASIDNDPFCAIAAFEWGAYLGEDGLKNGIRAKVSSYARSHANSHMLKGKINGMYVNNILAKREAMDAGYEEAIMLDTNGSVVEASGENIFVVRDGRIVTPGLNNVLAGVTRETSFTLLADMGHEVSERIIARDELYIADEIFMTGTAAEITPVREVDNRTVGTGKPGPITLELQAKYFDVVGGRCDKYAHWLDRIE